MFRNRENKKGGGVGFYVKDHLSFTLRNDITKMEDSIETIWIKVRGKNKNSAFLIGAFYQTSSDEIEKHCWLVKFDGFIAQVYVKWNGMIIIAGDFNINLNSDSGESTQRYKQILRRFYTRRNVSRMLRRHRFFLLSHMRKSFAYWHFPEMSIPLKSRNRFNFSAPNKCRFFLSLSFLCIHVNKVNHYNMAYSQSTISLKSEMATCFNLENSEISTGLLLLTTLA